MGHRVMIDDKAFELAKELASMTGGTVEQAVEIALQAHIMRERERQVRRAEIEAALAEFHKHLSPPFPSSDHSWLYDDETGLPA